MQSDRDSCCGNVVLYSVNMVFRDEDSLLDQIYEKQICLNFYYEYLIFVCYVSKLQEYFTTRFEKSEHICPSYIWYKTMSFTLDLTLSTTKTVPI